jgi:hypothetical protein
MMTFGVFMKSHHSPGRRVEGNLGNALPARLHLRPIHPPTMRSAQQCTFRRISKDSRSEFSLFKHRVIAQDTRSKQPRELRLISGIKLSVGLMKPTT